MFDKKIIEYIKTSLAQGKPKEELYKQLLNQGLTIDAIQENFNALGTKEEKEDTHKKTVKIIVTTGAILIGAGIFSFVAANWRDLGSVAKVGFITISMTVAYVTGWYLKERMKMPKTGGALVLLGTIIYGAGIFLVAQIFNIRANWPDGFILWMLGTIIMAYATETFPLFYLSILLGIIATIGHPIGIFTFFNSYNPFSFTSSFLLLTATLATFIAGWMMRKKLPPEIKKYY